MIAFKSRDSAQAWCNSLNRLPWFCLMVQAVPQGWIITKAKGVNNHG